MSTGITSQTARMQSQSQQIAGGPTRDIGIQNTNINTAPGVELSWEQKVIVGSVLDVRHSEPGLYASTKTPSSSQAGPP
jgi:hypothetical protein